jgi:hypothetical protein
MFLSIKTFTLVGFFFDHQEQKDFLESLLKKSHSRPLTIADLPESDLSPIITLIPGWK